MRREDFPERSIATSYPNGARTVIVLGAEAVEYSLVDAAGRLQWRTEIRDGPKSGRRRTAAARELEARALEL